MKRGSIDVTDVKRGDNDVIKLYRGEEVIWEKGTPELLTASFNNNNGVYNVNLTTGTTNLLFTTVSGDHITSRQFGGFVYVVSTNTGTLRKYTTGGSLIWTSEDTFTGVYLSFDTAGNIYTGPNGLFTNWKKFDSDGNRTLDIYNGGSGTWGIVVDNSGNVYTVGDRASNLTTRKYNSSGSLQWSRDHGTFVGCIAVDSSGNIYTGGSLISSVTTRKYNTSGSLLWSANHGANVHGIAVDSSGNVYTVGDRTSNLTTRKYNSSGSLQWSRDHGDNCRGGVTVDSSGNIYTIGDNISGNQIRKYDASGNLLWSSSTGSLEGRRIFIN